MFPEFILIFLLYVFVGILQVQMNELAMKEHSIFTNEMFLKTNSCEREQIFEKEIRFLLYNNQMQALILYLKHYFHQLISGYLRSMKSASKIMYVAATKTHTTHLRNDSFIYYYVDRSLNYFWNNKTRFKNNQKFNKKFHSFLFYFFNLIIMT